VEIEVNSSLKTCGGTTNKSWESANISAPQPPARNGVFSARSAPALWDSIRDIMFYLWQFEHQLRKANKSFQKDYRAFLEQGHSEDEIESFIGKEYAKVLDAEKELDGAVGQLLLHEARSLDVGGPPAEDKTMWFQARGSKGFWLTSRGRAHVRKLIDEERGRRFEVKTRWVTKLILPLLAALIGIIGAITGLVAVLQHKK